MSTLRVVVVTALFTLACGSEEEGNPAPLPTGTNAATETGSTGDVTVTGETTGGASCSAFIGCAELCENHADQQCIDQCADLTGSDAGACTNQYCGQLAIDCGMDVPDSCAKLMSFCGDAATTTGADGSTSTTDASTSSSSGSSSTGLDEEACDAYWNCQNTCVDEPDVEACEQTCRVTTMVDYEPCFEKHCDDLLAECAKDESACEELIEDCEPGPGTTTSTSDTGGTTGGTTSDTDGTTDAGGKTT